MDDSELERMLEEARQRMPTDEEIRQTGERLKAELDRLIEQIPTHEEILEQCREIMEAPDPIAAWTRNESLGPPSE